MTDLFPKPPRRKPRVLMHVSDGGDSSVELRCAKCGHEERFSCRPKENRFGDEDLTVTEAKRGVPCPKCNDPRQNVDFSSVNTKPDEFWGNTP